MEVRPGYKQTEAGTIPEDWDIRTIDQVAFVTSGKRLPLGTSLVDQPTPHPYIRVTDMRPGTIDLSSIKYVPESVFPAIKRYRIYESDIFISVAGSLGIVGKVPKELDGANLTENADRITNIKCSQDYLLYVLMAPPIQNAIDSISTVGAQPKLALTRIRKFEIPLPPTAGEQRAIATALSDVDTLLAGLDRLITKNRDLKQATMQQLLTGQTRLPGFHGEWESRQLASVIADLQAGVSVNSIAGATFSSSGEPGILKTSCIADGAFYPNECKVINPREIGRARLSLKSNTLIISRMNTPNLVGEVGFVDQDYPNMFLPDRLWMTRFRADSDLHPKWLAYVLSSPSIKLAIKELASGTSGSMKNIAKTKLLALQLDFPSLDEQEAIATVLSDMDTELSALEARLTKTRALKQGMMQELLTGRIRLI